MHCMQGVVSSALRNCPPRQFGKDIIQSGSVVHVMHNLLSCKHCILTLQLLLSSFFSCRAELIACSVCNHSTSFHALQIVQPAFTLFRLLSNLDSCSQQAVQPGFKLPDPVLNCSAWFQTVRPGFKPSGLVLNRLAWF